MIWSKSIKTCKSSEIRRKRISVECHCLRSISADLQLVAQPCRVFDARRLPAAQNGIALVKRALIKWQMAPANGLPSSRYSSPKESAFSRKLGFRALVDVIPLDASVGEAVSGLCRQE
jgi:hypothetical protein